MKIQEIKRLNLKRLVDTYGSLEALALAAATGSSAPHLSQIKTGWRDMGGRVSARIEKALRLPAGTLDRLPDNGDINPETSKTWHLRQGKPLEKLGKPRLPNRRSTDVQRTFNQTLNINH